MKIVLTESQYKTLTRRMNDFVIIDREFKLQLRKKSPCGYVGFDNYFDFVSYRTEINVIDRLFDDEGFEWELSLSIQLKHEVENYIKDNFKEYAKEYYDYYNKKNCPE